MRIVDVVGVYGIVILKWRVVGLIIIVVKVLIGVIEYIFVVRVINLVWMLEEMKEWGIWVVGMDVFVCEDYCNMDGNMFLVLVIGSEGKGMGCFVKEKCDFFIKFLMVGKVILLNVFVVVGFLMYEVYWK